MAVAWRRVLTVDDGTLLSATTQTIAGAKTFSSSLTASTINNASMWTATLYNNSSADHGNIKFSSSPNLISLTVGAESGSAALVLDDSDDATFIGTVTAPTFVGALTGNASGSSATCSGLAGSATVLASARDIAGQSFNGSASITIDIGDLDNVTVDDGAASGGATGDIWIEY